ncbi:nucleic acid binding protein [Bdellovibrio bacteriovorus W]|nr:nucleic acid binding protein [Bdellovibrio bacteriovorus W]
MTKLIKKMGMDSDSNVEVEMRAMMTDGNEVKVIRKRDPVKLEVDADQAREEGRALLEVLIRGMVDLPESVKVTFHSGDKTTVYNVDCDQKCLGQIIGARGKNITGIRAVMTATMARKGIRAIVEIPYFSVDA